MGPRGAVSRIRLISHFILGFRLTCLTQLQNFSFSLAADRIGPVRLGLLSATRRNETAAQAERTKWDGP